MPSEPFSPDPSRRDFIRAGAALTIGAALPAAPSGAGTLAAPVTPFRAAPMSRVRIGFVGVGGQGSTHVENLLSLDGVDAGYGDVKILGDIAAHADSHPDWLEISGVL